MYNYIMYILILLAEKQLPVSVLGLQSFEIEQ